MFPTAPLTTVESSARSALRFGRLTFHAVMLHEIMYVLLALSVALALIAAFGWLVCARRLASLRESETHFRTLADAIPDVVWTALPNAGIDYCNRRWCDRTGLTVQQTLGWGWKDALHPDDVPIAMENWERSRKAGSALDIEYRLRTRSGAYRWQLVRAVPLLGSSGNIVKWVGSCTDIDDQMRNQQTLEHQIREHTAALMEANTRLEAEMHERALAQQELNQQNERMVRELTKRSNRVTTLAKMTELLQSCADLKDAFSVVAGMAPKIFPEFRGAVLLFNSGRVVLEVAASWNDCLLPAPVFGPQDCWALRTGHLHLVHADDHTADCRHAGALPHSYFCLPLVSQGEAIGILHFQCMSGTMLS